MATQTRRSTKTRTPLSRERVLRAAVVLADSGGIEALTMRRLGEELQVEAMSLYNHVAGKDDILDGMVDLAFSEITLPQSGTPWKAAMRQRGMSARDVLLRHPWAVTLMQSRSTPGPATKRHHDAVIGSLRAAGFDIHMAAHAFSVMDGYIYGFALQQTNLPSRNEEESTVLAVTILRELPAADYPHLAEMIVDHALQPGYDYAKEFEFGLDLILDGLEQRLAT